MRNGNLERLLQILIKADKFLSYLWGMETMGCGQGCRRIQGFLSYLWGMETRSKKILRSEDFSDCSYPTYEEWKRLQKLYNKHHTQSSYPTYEEWKPSNLEQLYSCFRSVLILPMRNGNICWKKGTILGTGSSYPTYEEWKPHFLNKLLVRWTCSYPTYEEWKRLKYDL